MIDSERVAAYVRAVMQRDGVTADALPVADPAVRVRLTARVSGSARTAAQPVFFNGDRQALKKIERGDPLSRREAVRIRAIVLPDGLRPAFDIEHDTFADLPAPWTALNVRRAVLVPLIKGIGRLDLTGHPAQVFAGTAFVVGADLLLTNRHVAELFVEGVGDPTALRFRSGITAAVDLKQEVATSDTVRLVLTAPALILEDWDAALLRVAGLPAGVTALPLAASAPTNADGRLAALVGYPAIDQASDLVEQLRIFRGVFFKKRLMPGRLIGMRPAPSFGRIVTALAHDCTTLNGNSGSALIDVETACVMGLHFAGEHFVANFAVPSWQLAADRRVRAAGVRFV